MYDYLRVKAYSRGISLWRKCDPCWLSCSPSKPQSEVCQTGGCGETGFALPFSRNGYLAKLLTIWGELMDSFEILPWWAKLAFKIARKAGRWKHFRQAHLQIVNWNLLGTVYNLHMKVGHRWRDFCVDAGPNIDWDHIAQEARSWCNGFRDTMAEVIRAAPESVHCSLKTLFPQQGQHGLVATIARSDPIRRPAEFGLDHAHEVAQNTVFACLSGKSDGRRTWQPYSYFSCNDLPGRAEEFQCDRDNWLNWYKSTVVVPLRYRQHQANEYTIMGFLTFDVNRKNAFGPIPDVFSLDFNEYHELAGQSAVIHTAGLMADTLTGILKPFAREAERDEV